MTVYFDIFRSIGLILTGVVLLTACSTRSFHTDEGTVMSIERRSIRSADQTAIDVTINRPSHRPSPIASIVLVSGTGAFDEDVYFGVSRSPADLIFYDLSQALLGLGFSTIRYARRGVACDPNKVLLFDHIERPEDVRPIVEQEFCLDTNVISSITFQSLREDFEAVFALARDEAACTLVLAHSEGFSALAQAIGQGAVQPDAIVGIGALLESPQSVMHWQVSERVAGSLEALDRDRDGVTSNAEIRDGFTTSWASVFGNLDALLSPSGAWTTEDIQRVRAAWQAAYEAARVEASAHSPEELFEQQGQPVASFRWWQSWFEDSTPIATYLRDYSGPTAFLYGDRDSQTPPERQIVAHRNAGAGFNRRFSILPGVGHTLGDHVLMGPIRQDARALLLDEIQRLADQACFE